MTFLEKCIGVLAILVFMLITGVAKAEDKTITPQEFVTNVAEVPGKLVTFIGSEVEKTKAYQTKVWSEAKNKWPWTMFKGKENATQD